MSELFKEPSLFILYNGKPVNFTTEQIFDFEEFDKFYGVSYVSSPKFFSEIAKNFEEVNFILGIPDSEISGKFIAALNNILSEPENGALFFNSLSSSSKNKVINGALNIRYGRAGVMIHDKIYLLSNENKNKYRVIIGSANLSVSAFDNENKNYENIRIDDDKEIFDIYKKRWDYLYTETEDFIPEICKKQYKETKTQIVIDSETKFNLLAERLDENRADLIVPENYLQEIQKATVDVKKKLENIETSKKLLGAVLSSKRKDNTYRLKLKESIVKSKQGIKNYLVKSNKETEDLNASRELLLASDDEYLYKKLPDAENEENNEMTLYSKLASLEEIKSTLLKIDTFTKAYYDLAISPNEEIPGKIYEAILYAFTAPFIWRLKQEYALQYDRASVGDIPMFLVIGGVRESGKSTLLNFIAGLLGESGSSIYDYARHLDTAGKLMDLLESSNLLPIITDELSNSFFGKSSSPRKGENLVKLLSNTVPEHSMGTLIGTTNYADFSSAGQVIRRIYYLEVNNMFDSKKKKESMNVLRDLNDGISDTLFRDFSYRFATELRNRSEVFQIDDFMILTRRIFKDYYKECSLTPPKYFPEKRFLDYETRKKLVWKQLYFSTDKEYFKDNGDILQVNIDALLKNTTGSAQKKKTQLFDYMDETCWATDAGIGMYWFLKKKEFFRFIEYEPSIIRKTLDFFKSKL